MNHSTLHTSGTHCSGDCPICAARERRKNALQDSWAAKTLTLGQWSLLSTLLNSYFGKPIQRARADRMKVCELCGNPLRRNDDYRFRGAPATRKEAHEFCLKVAHGKVQDFEARQRAERENA